MRRHLAYQCGNWFLWFATPGMPGANEGPEWWLTPNAMAVDPTQAMYFMVPDATTESVLGTYQAQGAVAGQAGAIVAAGSQ